MDNVIAIALIPLTQEPAPLRRKIAATLRHAIEIGELKPGARLIEKDLCTKLNVSRTSLREALRELQAEKLVTAVPRGLVVAEIGDEEAANVYRVRAALEGLVAAQFAENADAADVRALESAMGELQDAYRSEAFERVIAAKKKFYNVICIGANNTVVRDILDHLSARINQLRSTSRLDATRGSESLMELEELARALCAGNPRTARAAAIRHIDAAARAASTNRRHTAGAPRTAEPAPRRQNRKPQNRKISGGLE